MTRPVLAIAIGDPAGIGPEVALKAARDKRVRAACRPLLVGDARVLAFYAERCNIDIRLDPIERPEDARFAEGAADVLHVETIDPAAGFAPGVASAECGRATLDYAARAIGLAMAGDVGAVVAAPQTERAIAAAGIEFDGYPGFVARQTGTDPEDVFLMLASDRLRIGHVTLHVGLRQALDLIDRPRIGRALAALDKALRRLGVAAPRIAVSGLNPHAGEGGLFGREEIETIGPAIEAAREAGIDAEGPFGADTMYLMEGYDAFLVMVHDQGHVPAKLLGFDRTAAFTIGTPILFASVAHGSAYDIAGKGVADPGCLVAALGMLGNCVRAEATVRAAR